MEEFNPGATTFYPVLGKDGELHAMVPDEYETAWLLARRIDGWIGETTFAKPMDLEEEFGPVVAQQIEDFLEDPQAHGVQRGRPVRSTSVDVENSTDSLDPQHDKC